MIGKKLPPRDGYGNALLRLARERPELMVLDADVAKSTRTDWVRDKFPQHFLDMGISEQDMVGTAAGLALAGMLPFATTYSVFLTGRAFDQIRTTVCNDRRNVKLGGAHAGISVGPDGATHQALEDMALMRSLPGMTMVAPCDAVECEKATLAIAKLNGPCYIRFGREAIPVITDEHTPFELGKARMVMDGEDAAIFANGPMVYEATLAAEALADRGVSVLVADLHTVKPLDGEFIRAAVEKTGAVVTAEEHQLMGGMGSAVCEYMAGHCPAPVEMVGVRDTFGESGRPEELMERYGLTAKHIEEAVLAVLRRKKD